MFNILFGGPAGEGINKASSLIARALVSLGYYVFNYREYSSLIKGGHNFNIISVSDNKIESFEKQLDVLVAFDETSLFHARELKKDGIVISSSKGIIINADKLLEKRKIDKCAKNMVFAGALFKILGLKLEAIIKEVKKEFKDKNNLKALKLGFASVTKAKTKPNFLPKIKEKGKTEKRYLISGSHGIAFGAIASGLDIYLAYPMTPSTLVMNELAARQFKDNFLVFQPENELAVINIALGASFSGARVMIGTSGGGFDLMTEALSMSGMTELPLVIYLASRSGPSTGIPTYSMQADLNLALYAGHGEFPRIVIVPGDASDCFEKTQEAFHLAQKYRTQVIILSDKNIAESEFTTKVLEPRDLKFDFIEKNCSGLFKNYKITDNGNSFRTVPGVSSGCIVKANSYEHDEFGNTTESEDIVKKMQDKRQKKRETIAKNIKFEMYKVFGQGKTLLVSCGSTKGPILDALPLLKDTQFLQLLYLEPFPDIKKKLQDANKIIVIEQNRTAQLSELIAQKTGIFIKNKILKYTARPFTPSEIVKEVKKR